MFAGFFAISKRPREPQWDALKSEFRPMFTEPGTLGRLGKNGALIHRRIREIGFPSPPQVCCPKVESSLSRNVVAKEARERSGSGLGFGRICSDGIGGHEFSAGGG